jgi:hypothetical protein
LVRALVENIVSAFGFLQFRWEPGASGDNAVSAAGLPQSKWETVRGVLSPPGFEDLVMVNLAGFHRDTQTRAENKVDRL